MLSKLLEEIYSGTTLTSVTAQQIKPNDTLVLHIFNDDVAVNKRLQVIDSINPNISPGLPDYVNQNPTALIANPSIPDGLYACLSNSPKQAITCVGSTSSTYVQMSEGDLFDFSIGNTSYTDKTFDEMAAIFASNDIELVTMMQEVVWTVQYTKISTGEVVQIDTGPIVSKETIDPTVDFTNTNSASYLQWQDDVLDRKDLIINTNVTNIEKATFTDWYSLGTINVLSGDIGDGAFSYLNELTTFRIGAKVNNVGNHALVGIGVENLIIEEGVKTFGDWALAGIYGTTDLIFPTSVTSLGQYVATGWSTPRKLVVGGALNTIRGDEFSGWGSSGANDLTLRQGITHVGTETEYAFQNWKGTSLSLPNSLVYSGKYAFHNWPLAVSLTIGSGALVIDSQSFAEWPMANALTLGGTISIGDGAFQNWTGFTGNLTIPGSTVDIYGSAFLNWEKATGLTINEGVVTIGKLVGDSSPFDGAQTFVNWYKAQFLHLPNSLSSTRGSFNNWFMCSDLVIGSGLTSIGGNEYLEDEFTNMGINTTDFDVVFPDTVTHIVNALSGSSPRKITIGNNVQFIDKFAFRTNEFYIRSEIPPVLADFKIMPNAEPGITVFVPNVDTYKANAPWASIYDIRTSQYRFSLFEQWTPA